MGIQFNFDTAAAIDFVDGLLMDVARRVQVPPIKHEEAIAHYTGLCEHVDRVGSPLEDKVLENYPSGSFSIHAKSLQHDVDVVVEVDVPEGTDPEWMLDTLFSAIKGQPGPKYYDFPIKCNSRCITAELGSKNRQI